MPLTTRLIICACTVTLGCQSREPSPASSAPAEPARSEAPRSEAPRSEPAPTAPEPERPPPPPLPDPLPGTRRDVSALVGSAWRAAIADLDGDGDNEIVLVDSKTMRVVEPSGRELASVPVTRGIQVLVAADVDGDGSAEIFAGWGVSRDHMDTTATVTIHRLRQGRLSEATVLAPQTTRQDVVALVPMRDEKSILIAYFDSKYMVTSVVAKPSASGWEATKIASIRTATSYARGDVDGDGKPDLVVGRVYGDDKGIDGDAFVLVRDGTRTPLKTTRGVRSLAIVDGEIFIGDGWHQSYAAQAHGLLTRAHHGKGGFRSELIEDTPGQYEIERIARATIGGKPAIVAKGNSYIRVFARTDQTWHGLTIAGVARDIATGDLDGKPGDEILIVGDHAEIVSLATVPR